MHGNVFHRHPRKWRKSRLASTFEWCRTVRGELDTLDFATKRLFLDGLDVTVYLYEEAAEDRYVITGSISVGGERIEPFVYTASSRWTSIPTLFSVGSA